MAFSNENCSGGTKLSASSDPDALVFVKCFSLHTFIAKSSFLEFIPTIIPSYTSTPGPIKSSPLSCALNNPYATDLPFSNATIVPLVLDCISPLYGAYSSNTWLSVPFPLVSVKNSALYPISPACRY